MVGRESLIQKLGLLARLELATSTFEASRSSIELQERKHLEHRTGFEPVSQRWQRRVLDRWTNDALGRGGQSRTVTTSSQDSDACVTPHPEMSMN